MQEQQMQQMMNYNGHMRSLSNSNCSGNIPHGYQTNQNIMMQQQQQQQKVGGKAPSSISLLNQTSIPNNLNTSNLLAPPRMNLANVNNMGNIAMTQQNLLIKPENSIKKLTAQ